MYSHFTATKDLTAQDWEEIWNHFNRMQKRVMATKTTRREFFTGSDLERREFYNWLRKQCGEYADLI